MRGLLVLCDGVFTVINHDDRAGEVGQGAAIDAQSQVCMCKVTTLYYSVCVVVTLALSLHPQVFTVWGVMRC